MHRPQIYLQEQLYQRLKTRSRVLGVSVSELIRTTLDENLGSTPSNAARDFFDRHRPLQSFADSSPEQYVAGLRERSRLIRKNHGDT